MYAGSPVRVRSSPFQRIAPVEGGLLVPVSEYLGNGVWGSVIVILAENRYQLGLYLAAQIIEVVKDSKVLFLGEDLNPPISSGVEISEIVSTSIVGAIIRDKPSPVPVVLAEYRLHALFQIRQAIEYRCNDSYRTAELYHAVLSWVVVCKDATRSFKLLGRPSPGTSA